MPIVDSVVVVGFNENSQAYEGLSTLKSLSDQQQLTASAAGSLKRVQGDRARPGGGRLRVEAGSLACAEHVPEPTLPVRGGFISQM